ncbi:MAG: division/cell wall cluster transcriptional repressor MraZ [Candidatus Saelkia tenebricola]|nr:division/cell wall cluster transcriptional repressor MraZ [Candidatus Saelkia tenebricola]
MFYGEYLHNLDEKGRIVLPAKFRQLAKSKIIKKFYLTRGMEKCLFLFSEQEWKGQEERFKALSIMKKDARSFNRIYFSGATEIMPDSQGRFLIPSYLKDYADIRKEIVVIGVSSRIEVWSRDRWNEFCKTQLKNFEEIAEKLIEE